MIWQSFDAGFTSVADAANGDNVVLKILDYQPTDETLSDWVPLWKTLNNRNYVRGFYDRDFNDMASLPMNKSYGEVLDPEDDFSVGRTLSIGRNGGLAVSDMSMFSRGIFPVGRRENLIRGSDLATAVVGNPGTLPGDMFTNGFTRTVDAIGVQNGMNYVDVSLTIPSGTTTNIYVFACGPNTVFKSYSDGDPTGLGTTIPVDFTWFLGIRPGAFGNINQTIGMRVGDHDNSAFATGKFTNQVTQNVSIPNDGVIRPFSMSGTVPLDASTKPCILAGLTFTKMISNQSATLPLRIGWPILDTSGWYHQRRRGLAHIVPLTAKADTVFKAHRSLQPILPMVPQLPGTIARKKFTFVLDLILDQLNTAETVSASVMPILRLFNNNSNQNVLTLCVQADNALQGLKPLWFNILTSTYLAGTDGILITPGRRMKVAATLDTWGLRWSINGGSVNSYSDGNNTGITQYYVNNMMLDGTGYLFKRLDALYRTCTNAELQQLSR